jgi:hypothetical protein
MPHTVIMASVSLPRDVHEVLRKIALERGKPVHELLLEQAAMMVEESEASSSRARDDRTTDKRRRSP